MSVHIHLIVIIPDNPTAKIQPQSLFQQRSYTFRWYHYCFALPIGVFACTSRIISGKHVPQDVSAPSIVARCNRKNCLNLFYVCDFWKSEDFQFAFHILCIGSDKIGHDFRSFLKLFFEVQKDIKNARISPDTVVTVPTSCPVGTRLVHYSSFSIEFDSFSVFLFLDIIL